MRLVRLLAALLFIINIPAVASASGTVLSSGRWIKIAVDGTGIFQLPYDSLRAAGFAHPEDVNVWGYGGLATPDAGLQNDIRPTATLHTEDGRILFYGEADAYVRYYDGTPHIIRNAYDRKGCYFLSDKPTDNYLSNNVGLDNGLAPDLADSTHLHIDFIENEVYNPGRGATVWHDKSFSRGDSVQYCFELSDYSTSNGMGIGRLTFDFAAKYNEPFAPSVYYPRQWTVVDSNMTAAPASKVENILYTNGRGILDFIPSSSEPHSATVTIVSHQSTSYAAIDKVILSHPRRNILRHTFETFHLPAGCKSGLVRIDSADTGTKVLDISDATNVRSVNTCYIGQGSAIASVEKTVQKLIVFDSAASFPTARVECTVTCQDLHEIDVPDMVIITSENLAEAANQLADIHRNADNITVTVINQEHIFNEFSSGTRTPEAYRNFLKTLYDRSPKKNTPGKTRLKHVLLYGRSHWNQKFEDNSDFILSYEAPTADEAADGNKNYVTDCYFAMLEDNFDPTRIEQCKMSVNVGRIDVANDAEARHINGKIAECAGRYRRGQLFDNVLLIADKADNGEYMRDCNDIAEMLGSYNGLMRVAKVYEGQRIYGNDRDYIAHALRSGVGLMLFSGHSSYTSLSTGKVFDNNIISKTDYNDYPLAILSTCETFGYDRNNFQIANALFKKEHGGAIGVIGASRKVYSEYNNDFARFIAEEYVLADKETTAGDVLRIAHNRHLMAYSGKDRLINALCYNLCGDPALKIGATLRRLDLTSISDGDTVAIKGSVIGDKSFDGELLLSLMPCGNNTALAKPIATAKTQISGGSFSIECPVPPGFADECIARLDGYDASTGVSAHAQCTVKCDGRSNEPDDVTIEFFNIEGTTARGRFGCGCAIIASGCISGDMASGINPLAPCVLRLDGRTVDTDMGQLFVPDENGNVNFEIHINDLSPGRHIAELTVRGHNNVIRHAKRSIALTGLNISYHLTVEEHISHGEAVIDLCRDFESESESAPQAKLFIEDCDGHTVANIADVSFPYRWNPFESGLQPGLYRAYAMLRDECGATSTPKLEIIIIR